MINRQDRILGPGRGHADGGLTGASVDGKSEFLGLDEGGLKKEGEVDVITSHDLGAENIRNLGVQGKGSRSAGGKESLRVLGQWGAAVPGKKVSTEGHGASGNGGNAWPASAVTVGTAWRPSPGGISTETDCTALPRAAEGAATAGFGRKFKTKLWISPNMRSEETTRRSISRSHVLRAKAESVTTARRPGAVSKSCSSSHCGGGRPNDTG